MERERPFLYGEGRGGNALSLIIKGIFISENDKKEDKGQNENILKANVFSMLIVWFQYVVTNMLQNKEISMCLCFVNFCFGIIARCLSSYHFPFFVYLFQYLGRLHSLCFLQATALSQCTLPKTWWTARATLLVMYR